MMGSNIHDAEHFLCLLNHSAARQSEETPLVPLSGSLFGLRATTTF